ncbi:hypothetical protein OGATHE_000830 [Ogataea polymorpha]|uniref:Uncharacterized protein n=1 Tax=Ogataea polymorpha TaxID=460523 RepID=A0A9P8TFV4_9ASCO|nr:hypothetical protein OGATHE_000830 [Ogataea polymorpha]
MTWDSERNGVSVEFVGLGGLGTWNTFDRSHWLWDIDSGLLVSKFADLSSISTQLLFLLAQSDLEEWNSVKNQQEDGSDNKRPCVDGDTGCQLVAELLVVVVEPSSLTRDTIVSSNDVVCSKQTGQHRTGKSTNTVKTPNIQTVVNSNHVLDVNRVVASNCSESTDWNGKVNRHETSCWSDTNKTSNSTRAHSDGGPFTAASEVVEEHPSKATASSSKVGVNTGVKSSDGGISGRSSVESKPSEPQENSTQNDTCDRMRSVLRQVGTSNRVVSLTTDQSVGQGSETRSLVDWSSTGKVVSTEGCKPAVSVPCPHGTRAVNDSHPEKQEHHHWAQSSSLARTTEHNASGDHGKHSLEKAENNVRHSRQCVRISKNFHQAKIVQ